MYPNLKAEMSRNGLKGKDLAQTLKLGEKTFSKKMTGKAEFTLGQARTIKSRFFPSLSLDYLFEDSNSTG